MPEKIPSGRQPLTRFQCWKALNTEEGQLINGFNQYLDAMKIKSSEILPKLIISFIYGNREFVKTLQDKPFARDEIRDINDVIKRLWRKLWLPHNPKADPLVLALPELFAFIGAALAALNLESIRDAEGIPELTEQGQKLINLIQNRKEKENVKKDGGEVDRPTS